MKRNKLYKLGGVLVTMVLLQGCVVIPASLPRADEVLPSEPGGFDGVWMISGINKRLQFDGGRAVVIDPWIHWGAGIEKGMVALVNLRTTPDGGLVGVDLVNSGSTWRGSMSADGRIDVAVEIGPTPLKYQMIPIRLDYPEFVQQVMPNHTVDSVAASAVAPTHTPSTQPVAQASVIDYAPDREQEYSHCVNLVVDPQTLQEVCLD